MYCWMGHLAEERPRHVVDGRRNCLQLPRRLFERHVDDRVAVERGHPPELPGMDEIGRIQPEASREDPVAWGGGAAALHVSEHRDARLVAGALLDVACERLADAPQSDVSELVGLGLAYDGS